MLVWKTYHTNVHCHQIVTPSFIGVEASRPTETRLFIDPQCNDMPRRRTSYVRVDSYSAGPNTFSNGGGNGNSEMDSEEPVLAQTDVDLNWVRQLPEEDLTLFERIACQENVTYVLTEQEIEEAEANAADP